MLPYVPDTDHKSSSTARSPTDVPLGRAHPPRRRASRSAGADSAARVAYLLMQTSGIGNCINMLSLTNGGGFRS